MEAVNDKLNAFLSVNGDGGYDGGYGYSDGYGGYGYGGYGYSDGYGGYGYGDGYGGYGYGGGGNGYGGYGYSDGDGGYDDGYGYGGGNGYGGYGYGGGGNGYGYSDGDGIKTINSIKLYYIDGMATIITAIYGNIAKGYILNSDLTLAGCYVAKSDNIYAHGDTIAEAVSALTDKLFDNMDVYDRIKAFIDNFEHNKKYPVKDFYEWHRKLTGSCDQGRRVFASNHNIDLNNDMYTVDEFIALTESSYGGEVIKKLKEKWQANG